MRFAPYVLLFAASPAFAGTLFSVNASTDSLVTIDTITYQETVIGPLNAPFDFGALAWDSDTQTMYMLPGRADDSLYTVNLGTGEATLVGAHSQIDLFAMAYDPYTQQLYAGSAYQSPGFFSLDRTNGSATRIVDTPFNFSGLAWSPQFGGLIGNQLGQNTHYWFDLATGDSVQLSSNSQGFNDGGLAWDPDTEMYYYINWSSQLWQLDPRNNMQATNVASLGNPHDGLASTAPRGRGPTLDVTGSCGGTGTAVITQATPNGMIALLTGDIDFGVIPAGPCADSLFGLDNASLQALIPADGTGTVVASGTIPQQVCGQAVQILDIATCTVSNIRRL